MNLKEYMADNDNNKFWRLSSGEQLNLLDEAIEEIKDHAEWAKKFAADPKNGAVTGLTRQLVEARAEIKRLREREDVLHLALARVPDELDREFIKLILDKDDKLAEEIERLRAAMQKVCSRTELPDGEVDYDLCPCMDCCSCCVDLRAALNDQPAQGEEEK